MAVTLLSMSCNNHGKFFLSACAEGITLGLFSFDKMKSKKKDKRKNLPRSLSGLRILLSFEISRNE